jgi:imidazolonepropionase-like amidohydrolase
MPSQPLALRGAAIFPDPASAPVRGGTVLIRDGRIAAAGDGIAVPPEAFVVDCDGCTILAGFWNSHVHFFERKWANAETIPADELQSQLSAFTGYGFTTVFDLSSLLQNTNALRERVRCGIPGPRIFTTGEGLLPPNGLPPAAVMRVLGTMDTPLPEVANAHRAADVAERLLDEGADAVKMFASSQSGETLATDVMRAAAAKAHARHKPAFAHVNAPADVASAIEAGVDVIAHTTPSVAWDSAMLQAMKDAGIALTPTLHLWQHLMRHDRDSLRERYVRGAVEQLRAWHASGGTVLFGTDYGAVGADPLPEYALMNDAGMDFSAILASLTTAPAQRFGALRQAQGDNVSYGRVAEGYAADLTVVRGDPATNLSALCAVTYTVRGGEIVYRG